MSAADPTCFPADWLLPQWPTPPGVFALCTTRAGGASEGLFGTTNLSFNVGDVPAHVERNRQLLAQAMQALELKAGRRADAARPRQPVFVRQVHGSHVQVLGEGYSGGDAQPADASVSDVPGLGCTVMAADCLPVLFCHQQLPVVARPTPVGGACWVRMALECWRAALRPMRKRCDSSRGKKR